jgi:hypothetical protein
MPGDFLDTPRLVDLVLAMTALECLGLLAYTACTGRGIRAHDLIPNLLAGACLILALRLAASGATWTIVGPCMLAALAAHLVDLKRRWRS